MASGVRIRRDGAGEAAATVHDQRRAQGGKNALLRGKRRPDYRNRLATMAAAPQAERPAALPMRRGLLA